MFGPSNDDIPEEEMLLAEVLAWSQANGAGYTSHTFKDGDNCYCAAGALAACKFGTSECAGDDYMMDGLLSVSLLDNWSWSWVYFGSDGDHTPIDSSPGFDFGASYRAFFFND